MGSRTGSARRAILTLLAAAVIAAAVLGCAGDKPGTPSSRVERSAAPARPEPATRPDGNAGKTVEPKPAKATSDDLAAKPLMVEGPKLEVTQQGVTLTWHEKGQVRMAAKAKSLEADEVTKTGALIDFSAQLYENGKLTASIAAPKAVADTTKREVTATGGVTLKSYERQTVVKAKWIKWFARQQKVVGDGGVNVKSPQWDLNGAAFVADTNMRTLSIRDSAKGLLPE